MLHPNAVGWVDRDLRGVADVTLAGVAAPSAHHASRFDLLRAKVKAAKVVSFRGHTREAAAKLGRTEDLMWTPILAG